MAFSVSSSAGGGGISEILVCVARYEESAAVSDFAATTDTNLIDLNILEGDYAAMGISLASKQLTIPAAKFLFQFWVTGHDIDACQSMIWDTTGGALIQEGSSEFAYSTDLTTVKSIGNGVWTPSTESVLELRMFSTTFKNPGGFGASSAGNTGNDVTAKDVYGEITITKLT